MVAIQKGDICVVDLTVSVGREQSGVRPAIVVSPGDMPGVVIVIPLTTNIDSLRFPHTLALLPDSKNRLEQESVALIFQVRAIDKKRIMQIIGKLDSATRKKIDAALKKVIRLSRVSRVRTSVKRSTFYLCGEHSRTSNTAGARRLQGRQPPALCVRPVSFVV